MKGIIKKRIIIPMTCTSSISPNFVAMYKILTKMLKIIEEIMKILSIDLGKFIDLFILLILPLSNI
ncbi:unnamed protein product [marine sediment metagenome]|uniref:Uncharacterized protein n=1 Tax=marine sediment metagenome TaxID=412755 RepID=X1VGA9_9ZZZZ